MTRRKAQFLKILRPSFIASLAHSLRVSSSSIRHKPQALKFLSRIDFWKLNFVDSSEKRSFHTFVSTPSLNYFAFTDARSIGCLSGLIIFTRKSCIKSTGHAAYCDSLADILVFSCLKAINEITIILKEYKKTTMCFYSCLITNINQ